MSKRSLGGWDHQLGFRISSWYVIPAHPTPSFALHPSQPACTMAAISEPTPPVQAQVPRPPSRYQQNLRKYGNPLPLKLLDAPIDGKPVQTSYLHAITPSFLQNRRIEVPQCIGTYDPVTRSVWVTKREDMDILFCRGFFGKGTLSRSEATWRDRRVDLVKGGDCE